MDYQANVDGILWFCREVWPGLQAKVPGIQLYIVGANPVPDVRRLAGPNVRVTGFVEDIREYYRLADVCIIPLRLARGVQNKLLEALAMGKPVVTTPKVLQGLQAGPGRDLLTADSPEAFEEQVLRLLEDRVLAGELGRSARTFVLEQCDWKHHLARLPALLKATPDQDRPRPMQDPGRLNPVFFLVFTVCLLLASLWPMQPDSPGASLVYTIDPGLQNFLHLPVFLVFAWLFMDFLQHFTLAARTRTALFALLGPGVCFTLEWLQLYIPGRYFGLTDILFNCSGLALGFVLYQLMMRRFFRGQR